MTWQLERLLEKAHLKGFKILDIYDVREEIKIHKRIPFVLVGGRKAIFINMRRGMELLCQLREKS